MKKTGLLLSFVIISLIAISQTQQPTISWDKTVHNFGLFKEEAGPQAATFAFTNKATSSLHHKRKGILRLYSK
jgi:hypothetical protein